MGVISSTEQRCNAEECDLQEQDVSPNHHLIKPEWFFAWSVTFFYVTPVKGSQSAARILTLPIVLDTLFELAVPGYGCWLPATPKC